MRRALVRAAVVREFGSFDRAGVEDLPLPVARPGEVVVEVHAAPVNYVDLVTFRGDYQFRPTLPYTPGKGPVGIVRQLGDGVSNLQLGDRVLAMAEYGGYAQSVAVDARQVYQLPDALSFPDAAGMALGFDTAWMALTDRGRLRPGESVLALGASGAVGGAVVQLARAMGAGRVLAAVSSPERFAGPERDRADGLVDLSRMPLRETIREQVFALTDGQTDDDQGVDVVVDPLGADAFDGALRALAWRGRLVVVGFAAGRIPVLKANYALLKNIEVSGLQISDYRKRTPELLAQCYREVFGFVDQGSVEPPRVTAAPLSQWREALQSLESRTRTGRLVLLPQE
jgi:NADPH2:quinone reductase